jgi:hypothetical protein
MKYNMEPITGKKRITRSHANFHLLFLKVEKIRSSSAHTQKRIKIKRAPKMK